MTKYTYLHKRRGVYYIRIGIPNYIHNILKKSEISYSLKTKDYREAVKKLKIEVLKVDKLFEDSKNNLHTLTKSELISIIKYRMSCIYWNANTFNAMQILSSEFDMYAKNCLKLPFDINFDKTTDIWQTYYNTMLEMNDCIKDIQYDINNGNSGVDAYCKLNDIVEKLSFIKEENTTITKNNSFQSIALNTPKIKHKWQDIFEEFWIKKINENPDIRDNAKSEYLSKLDTIFSLLKIEYVEDLTETICVDFVDKDIYKIPKRKNRDNKKWLKVNDTENEDRLSQKTIMTYKNTLKQFLAYIQRKKFITEDLASIMEERTGIKKNTSIKRAEFTDEDLMKIFNPSTYPNKIKDKARFWIPIWAMYSGARLNEICQLRFDDIKQIDDIWCFDINENAENKSIKNDSSKRLVPIHPFLIKLGLLDFIKDQKEHSKLALKENKNNIFYELKFQTKNGYGGAISNWFGRYLKDIGLKRPELTFHSFRHTVASRLANAGVSTEIRNAISGWTQKGTGERIYTHLDIHTIMTGLEKLKYESVEDALIKL